MSSQDLLLIGISTLFAGIPTAIWLYVIFKQEHQSKKTIAFIFLLGCLTGPALLSVQFFWEKFPQFNIATFIETSIKTQSAMFILTFVLFGAMEEIIKHYVISGVDKKTPLIKTIGDAIRYSFAAALGFSFFENVYYLYQFWPQLSVGEIAGMYIFRSIFTSCAHMIFSGIFGYYYGVGKFSIDISRQDVLSGETSKWAKYISKLFNLPLSQAYQQHIVLKGLFIAIAMHAVYNYLLQFNIILPVILFVVLGYFYLRYLLNRKTGHLFLYTDISSRQKSRMAPKDEDVVLELLGMWFKEKKYADVIHICERLLQRDPDNNVVRLFKAEAMDKLDDRNVYKKILSTVLRNQEEYTSSEKQILNKHLEEKELHLKSEVEENSKNQ